MYFYKWMHTQRHMWPDTQAHSYLRTLCFTNVQKYIHRHEHTDHQNILSLTREKYPPDTDLWDSNKMRDIFWNIWCFIYMNKNIAILILPGDAKEFDISEVFKQLQIIAYWNLHKIWNVFYTFLLPNV